jgi:ethanolamine utilization microcompartment shell protein EutS
MSLAAKYNDRIAFKFDEFAGALRFEGDLANVRSALTNEKLRLVEYEVLSKLHFKIGDSNEGS